MTTFVKNLTAPNGAAISFHKLVKIEVGKDMLSYTAQVASWPTEADYIAGKNAVWNTYQTLELSPEMLSALLTSVLASGDFESAIPMPDPSETLVGAKARKWAQMKVKREMAKDCLLSTPYGVFDSEKEDRDNIADEYALRKLLVERGGSGTGDFTLADNTVVQLTLEQLGDVALLLGQKVGTAYAVGRQLRTAIEAAADLAALDAIEWPEEVSPTSPIPAPDEAEQPT